MAEDANSEITKDYTLIKADTKRRRTVSKLRKMTTSSHPKDFMGMGAEGYITKVKLPFREGSIDGLVYKEIGSEGQIANALREWVALKNAGLPVPNTFRIVEEDGVYKGILMSDLTRGGRDILISSNPTKEENVLRVLAKTPSTVSTSFPKKGRMKSSWPPASTWF